MLDEIRLSVRSWLEHEKRYLEPAQSREAFDALVSELAWEQREIVLFGRRIMQPRLIAWAGTLPYRYSGQTLPPRRPTPTLERLFERISARAGVAFNHVLVNRYRDENDSMGMHSDDEPELGPQPVLASLSLGATRRFVVQPKKRTSGIAPLHLPLEDGDLVIMRGDFQHETRHGIPRAKTPLGERINLTFRLLHAAPA